MCFCISPHISNVSNRNTVIKLNSLHLCVQYVVDNIAQSAARDMHEFSIFNNRCIRTIYIVTFNQPLSNFAAEDTMLREGFIGMSTLTCVPIRTC